MVERHFTLNKKSNSPDVKFSITPDELAILKNFSLSKEKINKNKNKNKTSSEKNSLIFRRSIYAIKNIKKNEKFTKKNIDCYRPYIGLCASNYFNVLNKKASRNLRKFEVLKKNFII